MNTPETESKPLEPLLELYDGNARVFSKIGETCVARFIAEYLADSDTPYDRLLNLTSDGWRSYKVSAARTMAGGYRDGTDLRLEVSEFVQVSADEYAPVGESQAGTPVRNIGDPRPVGYVVANEHKSEQASSQTVSIPDIHDALNRAKWQALYSKLGGWNELLKCELAARTRVAPEAKREKLNAAIKAFLARRRLRDPEEGERIMAVLKDLEPVEFKKAGLVLFDLKGGSKLLKAVAKVRLGLDYVPGGWVRAKAQVKAYAERHGYSTEAVMEAAFTLKLNVLREMAGETLPAEADEVDLSLAGNGPLLDAAIDARTFQGIEVTLSGSQQRNLEQAVKDYAHRHDYDPDAVRRAVDRTGTQKLEELQAGFDITELEGWRNLENGMAHNDTLAEGSRERFLNEIELAAMCWRFIRHHQLETRPAVLWPLLQDGAALRRRALASPYGAN